MPTGYTAGILDGSIKDFKQYATTCMRAFGATIHMKEDSLDAEYEPREVSDHHSIKLAEALDKMDKIKAMTDDDIISEETLRIKGDIEYNEEQIARIAENKRKLEAILNDVKKWKEPTSDHVKFKEFMVSQIEDTMKFDANDTYNTNKINELKNINVELSVDSLRAELIKSAQWGIDYHTKENKEEIDRCNKSNKWVSDLMDSI